MLSFVYLLPIDEDGRCAFGVRSGKERGGSQQESSTSLKQRKINALLTEGDKFT